MKKVNIKQWKYGGVLRCFILGLITALIIFGFSLYRNNGVFTVCDDFDDQMLTFAQAVWNVIYKGNGGQWCWNLDLGTSLVSGFGYYYLGSPFYWIFLAFPKGFFPYLSGPLYILKYAAACVTSYIYLSCFKDEKAEWRNDYALIGALLYAFSGFQTVNLEFFIFHDVAAVFPLLLWGIENIDNREKTPIFVISVFLSCLMNYFFFIQEVVFMVIYFFVRFWGQPAKELFRKMGICIVCGILGVGMASILFIPSLLYITESTRSESGFHLCDFVYDSKLLLYQIKGILLPGEAMRGNSAVINQRWLSTSCYLPMVGISAVIAYVKKSRTWLQRFLIILFVISASPFAQSVFLLFTASYQRWWFMLVLMMVLATVKVLEKPQDYALSKGILIYVAAAAVFYICIKHISWDANKEQMVFFEDRFAYYFTIAVFSSVLLDLLLRIRKYSLKTVLPLTMVFCVVTTGITLHYYHQYDPDTKAYFEKYEASIHLKKIHDQYRYNSTDNIYTLNGEAAGIGVYSSTVENSSHDFNRLLGIDTAATSQDRVNIPGLGQFLGGKYEITTDPSAENIIDTVRYGDTSLYVTEGKAFPIGFAMDHYIFTNELASLPREQRVTALMNGAVIFPSSESSVNSCMNHLDLNAINYDEPIDDLIAGAEKAAVKDFSRDEHGFRCSTDFEQERAVYFSVPNDKGWTATIDGQPTDIIDSGGMMVIKVPQGRHSIDFAFKTCGLNLGITISTIAWMIFIGWCLFAATKHLRKNEERHIECK